MTEQTNSPLREELEALDRIARSPDGHLLHRLLRRELEAVAPDNSPSGALPALNGRRSLARDLMRSMAQGIEATSGSHTDSILARRAEPVAIRRRGSFREYAAANDPELDPNRDDTTKPLVVNE